MTTTAISRGASAGIGNADRRGGAGDAIFDADSGDGSKGGGVGDEDATGALLILSGSWADFRILRVLPDERNITGWAMDLGVETFEMFRFDTGHFTFGQVFPGPAV